MTVLTLAVVAVASIIIWVRRPAEGLVAYIFVLCLYPQYLAVSIGSIDWSATRLLSLVFVARFVSRPMDPGVWKLRLIDLLVLLTYVGAAIPHFLNDSFFQVIERESGHFFDIVIVYGLARLSLQKREDAYTLMNGMVWVAMPLALIGIYQSVTGHNPYAWMRAFSPSDIGPQELAQRHGFYRADASFGNKISFGLFFSMAWGLHIAMLLVRPNPLKFMFRGMLIIVGIVSAMSSAPVFAMVASMMFMASFPMRRLWPYVLMVVVMICSGIEIYSDRHFYHVLTRLAFDSRTAFYRIELMEEALGGCMSGHWLFGYGYVSFAPGAPDLGFHWRHNDLANIYIVVLARSGLMGVVPLLMLNGHYYWCLYRAGRVASGLRDKWTIWCIAGSLIGWNVAMLTVGALEQTNQIMYIVIALAGVSGIVFAPESEAEEAAHEHPPTLVHPRAVRT